MCLLLTSVSCMWFGWVGPTAFSLARGPKFCKIWADLRSPSRTLAGTFLQMISMWLAVAAALVHSAAAYHSGPVVQRLGARPHVHSSRSGADALMWEKIIPEEDKAQTSAKSAVMLTMQHGGTSGMSEKEVRANLNQPQPVKRIVRKPSNELKVTVKNEGGPKFRGGFIDLPTDSVPAAAAPAAAAPAAAPPSMVDSAAAFAFAAAAEEARAEAEAALAVQARAEAKVSQMVKVVALAMEELETAKAEAAMAASDAAAKSAKFLVDDEAAEAEAEAAAEMAAAMAAEADESAEMAAAMAAMVASMNRDDEEVTGVVTPTNHVAAAPVVEEVQVVEVAPPPPPAYPTVTIGGDPTDFSHSPENFFAQAAKARAKQATAPPAPRPAPAPAPAPVPPRRASSPSAAPTVTLGGDVTVRVAKRAPPPPAGPTVSLGNDPSAGSKAKFFAGAANAARKAAAAPAPAPPAAASSSDLMAAFAQAAGQATSQATSQPAPKRAPAVAKPAAKPKAAAKPNNSDGMVVGRGWWDSHRPANLAGGSIDRHFMSDSR